MRRSGSSSCLLRPRSSTDSLDSIANQQQQAGGGGPPEQLSVTMISREELPSFSTERFFMLSEFHLNSHSMRFVTDLQDSDELTPETVDTSFTTGSGGGGGGGGNNSPSSPESFEFQNENNSFPPYLIFYILWRPDMIRDVTAFTSEIILPSIEKIQSHIDIALSDEDKKRTTRTNSSNSNSEIPNSPSSGRLNEAAAAAAEQQHQQLTDSTSAAPAVPGSPREHDSVTGSSSLSSAENNGKTRLYLVVERTCPFVPSTSSSSEDETTATTAAGGGGDGHTSTTNPRNNYSLSDHYNNHYDSDERVKQFEKETTLAENLAKYVASHKQLRSIFQGITIGVANHKRAAPGLDACVDVINFGARDRRRVGRDVRSHVGLISMCPDDLLGLDEEGETDAVQNVLQTRISIEWNGNGSLKSFAYRAHTMWRRDTGLPPLLSTEFPLKDGGGLAGGKRGSRFGSGGGGRRLGRLDEELESFPLDLLLNIGAFLLIAYYVWQGLINGGVH